MLIPSTFFYMVYFSSKIAEKIVKQEKERFNMATKQDKEYHVGLNKETKSNAVERMLKQAVMDSVVNCPYCEAVMEADCPNCPNCGEKNLLMEYGLI